MFCIAQFRHARNGNKLGNLTEWLVFDLGLKGIFILVLRFAARRASGWRTAQQFVCPTSVARQYFNLPGTANFPAMVESRCAVRINLGRSSP